uniref:murein biosynthesis integral membrane protein MurJ n=1 Tax=Methylobacterium sp. B34 TaxID=95563 RepID=UPI0005B295E8
RPALLPVLARHVAAGDEGMVRHYLSRALEFSLLLGLPAAVALGVAGGPIVAVLFQRGAFGPEEAHATALALAAYAIGIPAYVIVKSLNAAFFARHDTVTPVRVAVIVTVATALLALALMPWLGHVGIALATGLTAWLDVGLLVAAMRKRGLFDLDDRLKHHAPRIAVAAVGMGGMLMAGEWLLAPWLAAPSTALRFAALGMLVSGGAMAFGTLALVLGGASVGDVRRMLSKTAMPAEKRAG